jgi:CRISPR/Cas system-associated exonuclease Cas4 (RecB family)
MEYFLERIARSLNDEFGNTLNRHCLVFPGRRAGLYFLKHLSGFIEKPVWTPSIFTINDLFRSYINLQQAGTEVLLFELYTIYSGVVKTPEKFDNFYFWGDMLLNDFDDVDKYLVDASALFENVKDLKTIDQHFGELTEEQKKIIRQFWTNFDISNLTNEKQVFVNIWSILSELYSGFRKSLREKNLAYEGMIFRDVAEKDEKALIEATKWDCIHFIGFNALNECEKRLMLNLKKAGKARFYWDYDNSYINEGDHNSAGYFMRGNLKLLGNDMPAGWNYNTMLSAGSGAKRYVIETSSDLSQAKLIPALIDKVPGLSPGNAHHTAIVLADENLLVPVLSSLPENELEINITMGYPLKQTLVYTLIKQLLEMQRTCTVTGDETRYYSATVLSILRHPLVKNIAGEKSCTIADEIIKNNIVWVPAGIFSGSAVTESLFCRKDDAISISVWLKEILALIASLIIPSEEESPAGMQQNIINEFIYRVVLSLNRLDSIKSYPGITLATDTWIRLFDRMLRSQSIPFSGEPLTGVQIMGILETRALDFRNLIILSVNEGVLPSVSSASSFIPFSLREAFKLPSMNHQESVYAYHFYRLLQRAENVYFTYNSNSEGMRNGEMSRFLIQMNYNESLKPAYLNVGFEIKSHSRVKEVIEKNEAHLKTMSSLYDNNKALSPSAINSWLNCRMKFYYRYVEGLKEPEVIREDIDPAMFGNILHEVMKNLYSPFAGKVLSTEALGSILKNRALIEKIISDAIKVKFRNGNEGTETGDELIIKDILYRFIVRILRNDNSSVPLTILNLEEFFGFSIEINSGNDKLNKRIGGIADRIDRVGDGIRIVDYKTGSVADTVCTIDDLFEEDRDKEPDGWLQTLLYCEAYINKFPGAKVSPSIYKIKKMNGCSVSDKLILKNGKTSCTIEDYREIRSQFTQGLNGLVTSIFSKDEPFTMTKKPANKCRYCAYSGLCLR